MPARIGLLMLGLLVSLMLVSPAQAQTKDRAMLVTFFRGLPADLNKSKKTDSEIVAGLIQATLSRVPKDQEKDNLVAHLKKANNRELALQDALWALMNTKEFMQVQGFANFGETMQFVEEVMKGWRK